MSMGFSCAPGAAVPADNKEDGQLLEPPQRVLCPEVSVWSVPGPHADWGLGADWEGVDLS